MLQWIRSHVVISALGFLLLLGGLSAIVAGNNRTPDWVSTTVTRGDVREIVTVSGTVEATQTATLSFPTTGVVATLSAKRGDAVETGQILAALGDATILAERRAALAALAEAEAQQLELQAGQTTEAAAVTETTLENARTALTQTQALAREQVGNAFTALLSNDLEALASDPDEEAAAPTVSGSYTCTEQGTYTIAVYSSGADSGYSYRLTGLETDTASAATEQPAPMGSCGLYIQFDVDSLYAGTEWTVAIPNTRSATYVARKNAYTLALTQAETNVAAARDALRLAENTATQATAGTRVEALLAANARVQRAQAQLQQIDARLAERALYAPFAGVVTDVSVAEGEVATLGTPAVSLLAVDAFELTARVPEIDITKLAVGQRATAYFDAKRDESVSGRIIYVAPEATEIDGVGYFETVIVFDTTPTWMRAGLNADIDITMQAVSDVPRLPQRFVQTVDGTSSVLIPDGNTTRVTPVTTGLVGNDGYVEVTDLSVGDTVVAP